MSQEREPMIREIERLSADNQELVEALADMYGQYCGQYGHAFMSAGELASSVLEKYGYKFDDAGRTIGYPTPTQEGLI